MRIAVIYGSVRSDRQGIKAARYIERKLAERSHDVTLVDPREHALPMLDRMYKEYAAGEAPPALEGLAGILREADGYVVVSAEYNHSIPPPLSNLLDHFMEEYFFKPSAIVCYSAGAYGGVRAAMQLRAMLPEIGTPSIPSVFPVPKVQEFGEDGTPPDPKYDKRVKRFLDEFEWYLEAMKAQREKGLPY
ncbi:MAG: NADPH-dependent FMN reductase [Planctomycetota bacterium]|jgi:NAD(P)H-dependent FMN reductase